MDNNLEDSNYRQFDSLNRSIDNEATFLKKKLIETHNKLLRQLQANKDLESRIISMASKIQLLNRENETLNRRISQLSLQQKLKEKEDRQQFNEKRVMQLQSKNELLRIDLESMRNKILSEMLQKSNLEELLKHKQQKLTQLQELNKVLAADTKKKQVQLVNSERNLLALRQKQEGQNQILRRLSMEIQEKKKAQTQMQLRISQLENQSKYEKQKMNNVIQDSKNKEKEILNLKSKLQANQDMIENLKNKLYVESKDKPIINNYALEKMTQQFNALSVKYKQLQKELVDARNIPVAQSQRKRVQYTESKQFVERLQQEQRHHLQRRSQTSVSPVKVKEKKEYMEKINEMGVLENTLLQCNISKNRILTEMDKIDSTKVKTNELITKRRRLEEDLRKTESLAEESKKKLKQLNVI